MSIGDQISTVIPSPDNHEQDALLSSDITDQTEALHAMRIAIAIDDKHDALVTEALLHRGNFKNTRVIPGGQTLLSELEHSIQDQSAPIDLILISSTQPNHTWQQICESISCNKALCDIPVILIASEPEWLESTTQQAFNSNITDVIYAPLRPAHFTPHIYSALLLKKERIMKKINAHELESELAEHKKIDQRLQYIRDHDDLTGLYSRSRLVSALDNAIIDCASASQEMALLHINLDQFKVINDLEGHHAGDQLLIDVADLLRRFIDNTKMLARISADEYTILVQNANKESSLKFAESIRDEMRDFSFDVSDRVYNIGVSIGIVIVVPDKQITVSEMLTCADQACFIAKKHGRNMIHLHDDMDRELHLIRDEAHWGPKIKDALLNNRFALMFQPVINLKTDQIDRYEALIRMYDAKNEFISPEVFIPVAERIGMIHDIDNWVINEAIVALRDLPEEQSHISLNINLSSHIFHDSELLQRIKECLHKNSVDANRITFEITETAAIENYKQTREMIVKLRELGCKFALDDFGVGFNSFSYLKHFPVDYLKIDGSFITDLVHDPVDQTLVKAMVKISKTLGKKIVAEFVESEEVLAMIKSYGIDHAQGYYIGKPATALKNNLLPLP